MIIPGLFFTYLQEPFTGLCIGHYGKYIVHILSLMQNGCLTISCISDSRKDLFSLFSCKLLVHRKCIFLWYSEKMLCNLSFCESFYFLNTLFLNSETLSSKSIFISKNCVWNIDETFNSLVAFFKIYATLFFSLARSLMI